MTRQQINYTLLVLVLLLVIGPGCQKPPVPEPFSNPIESRLILQVPFYSVNTPGGGAAALASVMTHSGRPVSVEKAELALDGQTSGQSLAVFARHEGLKADVFSGTPEQLIEAVRRHRPVIVRLDQVTPPLAKGDYAVVVGYTPDGPVLNSCTVNQQIILWKNFLAGWHAASNFMLLIEPME